MSGTDRTITLATFLKWEAPAGNVRLCDGGFVTFAAESYAALHPVFGAVQAFPEVSAGFGDAAEAGQLVLMPAPGATLTDWWRADLFGTRLRLWLGEVGSDLVSVSSATLLADWLVDNVTREQGPAGSNLLTLDLVSRSERLFLVNEGNVCSDRFHQTVYSGELGFKNCTDVQGYFAWGAVDSGREEPVKGGKSKKNKAGG